MDIGNYDRLCILALGVCLGKLFSFLRGLQQLSTTASIVFMRLGHLERESGVLFNFCSDEKGQEDIRVAFKVALLNCICYLSPYEKYFLPKMTE